MTDDSPDNVLFEWYERFIGEPEAETDVYLGFGLFFTAIGLALLALVLFVVGVAAYGIREDGYFAVARVAYASGMLSVPLAMFSIVVLLPVKQRATMAAGAGVAVTVAAVVGFAVVYPDNWFDYGGTQTLYIVSGYAVGLMVVTAATGAALVAHHLQRTKAPAPSEIKAQEEEEDEETYTTEEIERDIEEAMADVEMTWGGVEKSENRRLKLNTDFADAELQAGGLGLEGNKTVESGGVDDQVQGLRNLKGGETKTATSESTVDNQTAALNELKQQKKEDQVPTNAPTASSSFLGRLLDRLGLS
ncbi:hypothetical protein L593_14840 [Salinarchaeum sp. Harcht-Bsk1]|uniref:DUF7139 domain-containing protein n=1 Tax=Salinarchaeum sp. Harcht-Bsk1 TaxID=1333523 RepID=UPI00034243BA|nr:hypothetical protein [Salinarchaeum sp. Harcht-Bsk1]AGN02902.1 hypothetical protein L593_14840 [Salinarchaeum sp. Harcht-Bsk1]